MDFGYILGRIKDMGMKKALIGLGIGVLLLIVVMPGEQPEQTSHQGQGGANDDMQQQLMRILEQVEGVGEVEVMLTFKEEHVVEGVLIVAQGGDVPSVRQEIYETVEALFSVPAHKIKICKRVDATREDRE